MTITLDYTFSDSPFFYDRRNLSIPQQESAIVQVSRLTSIRVWASRNDALIVLGPSLTCSPTRTSGSHFTIPKESETIIMANGIRCGRNGWNSRISSCLDMGCTTG